MKKRVKWKFPLPRTHTGMALGNATTGLLVWGEANLVKITIGRADLWDNRGGLKLSEKQNYKDIKRCLEAKDEKGLRDIFKKGNENISGLPDRPSVIPVGRIDLILPERSELKTGVIVLQTSEATIQYSRDNRKYELKINIAMESQKFCIETAECNAIEIKPVPAWEFLEDYLKSISFQAPIMRTNGGWVQALPENEGICVAYTKQGNSILAVTERASDKKEMNRKADASLKNFKKNGIATLKKTNKKWWDNYWKDIPEIDIPNPRLDFCYSYGLYKFAGLTNPSGTPATLQGPWIEEYDMPPWSSDYHFNINVQMCYWPACKANRLSHLLPLFKMIWSWKDRLRANAKAFLGIDDGFMLPHAVDDKCTCMGAFWTGMVDHACTAMVAQMMYQYVLYSGDKEFLRDIAYPFMKGAMRVFEELLKKNGESYSLPLSVSPEYRGAEINAWGKNSSFQLASIHRLCEDIFAAAKTLGKAPSPIWTDIKNKLPEYTLVGNERIALWEGTDLEESHRHHSHIGAICPFDTINIFAPENIPLINNTIRHWVQMGTGKWTGWSLPWASMLYSRMQNGDMAEHYIEVLTKVYMNEGYGTLHDCRIPGFSIMGGPAALFNDSRSKREGFREIMQVDAGMGAVAAIQDMLLHSRRGIVYIFPGLPSSWTSAKFTDMPCEGGFLVSAQLQKGKLQPIIIKNKSSGIRTLKLSNPWGGQDVRIVSAEKDNIVTSNILDLSMAAETECSITPA